MVRCFVAIGIRAGAEWSREIQSRGRKAWKKGCSDLERLKAGSLDSVGLDGRPLGGWKAEQADQCGDAICEKGEVVKTSPP